MDHVIMTADEKMYLYSIVFVVIFLAVSLGVSIGVNPSCGIIGISYAMYSIIPNHNCTGILVRDWLVILAWLLITIHMVLELRKGEKIKSDVIGQWSCLLIGFTFLEPLVLLMFVAGIALAMYSFLSNFIMEYLGSKEPLIPSNMFSSTRIIFLELK